MEKKNRSRTKNVITTILFILLIILLGGLAIFGRLLDESLIWLRDAWGGVSFRTALFQLSTPMEGVNTDAVDQYIEAAVKPTVFFAAIPLTITLIIALVLRARKAYVPVSTRKKEKKLTWRFFMFYGVLLLLLASWYDVPAVAKDTGATDYLVSKYGGDKEQTGNFYEDYYADPATTPVIFPAEKRNLVMIYMESMEASYASTDVGGGKEENLIPNLTDLAFQNTSFSDSEKLGGCTATEGTGWTMAAILSSSSGVPFAIPVEGNSMEGYDSFLPELTTLGDVLEENGYTNYFCCGSDATFGGRRLYLQEHGDYTFYDYLYAKEKGYITDDYFYGWGMEDIKTYAMAKAELTKVAAKGEPFNFTFLTVDTHHPGGIPCEECDPLPGEPTYATCIRCSDRHVTDFLKWIQAQDWYENTTVVLVGDHCSMVADFWDDLPDGYERHVYNCFVNLPDGLTAVNTTNRQFSTEDYFPTIVAALGARIDGDRLGLGTNLFSGQQTVLEQVGLSAYNEGVMADTDYYMQHFNNGALR